MPTAPRRLWSDPVALLDRLRAVVPAARFVSERRLALTLAELDRVPPNARLPVWVDRDRLATLGTIPASALAGDEPRLLLFVPPDDRFPGGADDTEVREAYSRLLFRGVLDGRLRALPTSEAAARFAALPAAVRREVRHVLEMDRHLPPDPADADLYVAFALVLLDLRAFDPGGLPDVFPLLAAENPDLDALTPGLDWPAARERCDLREPVPPPAAEPPSADPAGDPQPEAGNHVRAAVAHARKAIRTGGRERDRHLRAARRVLRDRLLAGFGWPPAKADAWADALARVLPAAAAGVWPPAARALYELQTAAADLGRPVYAVAAAEWAMSLGRRPLKRSLARVRDVILLRHLHAAERHLLRVKLPEAETEPALDLLHAEIAAVEARARADLGPVIHSVLDRVGLTPANRAEEVARDKLVAELLDRACDRGFLRLPDLRDAIARNQLKLPDLAGPGELARGDPLLRADALLADALYGVYRRGEAYLRLVQRGMAAAFGTPAGRVLSLYLALPLLASVFALGFAQELAHLGHVAADWAEHAIDRLDPPDPGEFEFAPEPAAAHGKPGVRLLAPYPVLGFAVVAFLLIHVRPVRRAAWGTLVVLGTLLRAAVALPAAVLRAAPVRAALRSRPVSAFRRHLLLPLLLTALAVAAFFVVVVTAFPAAPRPPAGTVWGTALLFASLTTLLSLPSGLQFQDDLAEAWSDTWRYVRGSAVPGLIAWVGRAFRALAGWVEGKLYAVDEWFRFREGQRESSLAVKAALALVWFPVAYLFRFAFYLLVEPQVNPIKHFPVVTVSHKLLLPLIGTVADVIHVSEKTAALLISGVPGVFGFLAWELKENWRLYAANRPDVLPPAVLGHHGETMRGLLRPGFHSGTVPNAFRKLRATHARPTAERRAAAAGLHHDLDHVARAVAALVERELFPLWRDLGANPTVRAVTVGCQRIEVRVGGDGPDAVVSFENVDGRVVAATVDPGWAKAFPAAEVGLRGLAALGADDHDPPRWDDWVRTWDAQRAK